MLSLEVSVLQQHVLPWTRVFYNILRWLHGLVSCTAAYAVPGRVFSTVAFIVLGVFRL
jgi:hypothetical protein